MLVYGIKDTISGEWWSRNKWGTVNSIPDLFLTRKNAEYQTKGNGKLAFIMKCDWNVGERNPVLVEIELIVRN
jgi:hypothetical protein